MKHHTLMLLIAVALVFQANALPYSNIPDGSLQADGYHYKKASANANANSFSESDQQTVEIDGTLKGQSFNGQKTSKFASNGGSHAEKTSFSSGSFSGSVPINLIPGSGAEAAAKIDFSNTGSLSISGSNSAANEINRLQGADSGAGQASADSGYYYEKKSGNPFLSSQSQTGCGPSGCTASASFDLQKGNANIHAKDQRNQISVSAPTNPFLNQASASAGSNSRLPQSPTFPAPQSSQPISVNVEKNNPFLKPGSGSAVLTPLSVQTDQQTQQTSDLFPSNQETLDFPISSNQFPQQPFELQGGLTFSCNGQNKICVAKHLCENGYTSQKGSAQIKPQGQECNLNTEVCCTLKTSQPAPQRNPAFGAGSNVNAIKGSSNQPSSGYPNGGLFGSEDLNNGDLPFSNEKDSNGYLPPLGSEPSSNVPAFSNPPQEQEVEGEANDASPSGLRPQSAFPPAAEVPPQVGCAAALLCVEEQFCTLEGVISTSPVTFTEQQLTRRAPLSSCKNPDNGIIGKCCRDPNYVDPWPTGNLPANYTGGFDEMGFPTFLNIAKTRPQKQGTKTPQRPIKSQQPTKTQQPIHPQQPILPQQPFNSQPIRPQQPFNQQPNQPEQSFGSQQPSQTHFGTKQPIQPQQPIRQEQPFNQLPSQTKPFGTKQPIPQQPFNSQQPIIPQQSFNSQPIRPQQPFGQQQPIQPEQPFEIQQPTHQQQPLDSQQSFKPQQPFHSQSSSFEEEVILPQQPVKSQYPTKSQQPTKYQPTKSQQPIKSYQPVKSSHPTKSAPPSKTIDFSNLPGSLPSFPTGEQITQAISDNFPIFSRPQAPAQTPADTPAESPAPVNPKPPGFFDNFPSLPSFPFTNPFGQKQPPKNSYEPQSTNEKAVIISPHTPGVQCGLKNQVQRPSSLSDVDVAFGEIPWQAMILSSRDRKLLCSGAIVSPNVVLTAAHCVDGLNPSDVSIKAGEWKLGYELKHEEPLPFEIVKVASIVLHPGYSSGNPSYDTALLFLEHPVALDQHVDTICIGDSTVIKPGRKCIATGWGKTVLQVNVAGALMHSINVDLLNQDECRQRLQNAESQLTIDDSLVCVKPQKQSNNLCQVDVGGPLACDRGDGFYEITGVYSQETGCLPTNQVATFATIDSQWVQETMQSPPLPKIDQVLTGYPSFPKPAQPILPGQDYQPSQPRPFQANRQPAQLIPQSVQPIQPAQPIQLAQPIQTAQPIQPAQPIRQPAQPIGQPAPSDSQISEPFPQNNQPIAQPTQPIRPAAPSAPITQTSLNRKPIVPPISGPASPNFPSQSEAQLPGFIQPPAHTHGPGETCDCRQSNLPAADNQYLPPSL